MNVMYLSDNNYAIYMGVSICSLFENNKMLDEINVYIIDDNISSDNKKRLEELAERYGRNIYFMDCKVGIDKLQKLGAPKYRGSYTTYLKIFAFNQLPDTVHKILFIDSDSVVVNSIEEVDKIDMGGNPIAAVKDNLCYYDFTYLGYEADSDWFNMGVMLVDVDMWKKQNCEKVVIEKMKQRVAYVAVDQNLLNISFYKHISTLPIEYNMTQHPMVYSYEAYLKYFPMKNYYTKTQIQYGKQHAIIHHFERFIGESPWHLNNVSIYNSEFDYYLEKTSWNNYKKQKSGSSMVNKIEKILYRILPHDIFLKIFCIGYKRYILNLNRKLEKGVSNFH